MGKWIDTTQYNGMISLRKADELPIGYCAYTLNSDLSSSSSALPLKGYSSFGNSSNEDDKIEKMFNYYRGEDTQVLLRVRDDSTNYIVEYLNTEDVRNNSEGEWCILEAGLSRSNTLFNGTIKKAYFSFAPFNDTGTNQLVYGNGIEAQRIWNGATAEISATTSNTITLDGSRTWTQRGFGATGSVIINGTDYAYTGGAGTTTLTGVTPDPTGEADGSGIAQVVDTSTLSAVDKGSILLSSQARVFIVGITATPNQVTFSDVGDLTNYSGDTPSDGGFEDFPQLNGPATAISDLNDWIVVFSERKILAFKYEFPTSTTRVVILKEISSEGTTNPNAVKKIGNRLFYITPKGGIKYISQITEKDIFEVNDLTSLIRPTINNWVWDEGSLIYDEQKQLIIASGKSDSDQTVNNKAVTLQLSIGIEGNEQINIGILDWFIRDGDMYNEELHIGSSIQSKDYLAFDGWSKDGAPYIWRRIERIELFGSSWDRKYVKYLGVKGSIASGAKLKISILNDTAGKTSTQEMQIKGTDSGYIVENSLNVLNAFQLGTEPLGGTNEDIADTNQFEVIFPLPIIYARNFQILFETDGTGQNVEIDSHSFYVEDAKQLPAYVNELKELGTD